MDINRNNYEAYLLDLMEGRLSDSDQQKVKDFLILNPDCSPPVFNSELRVLENSEIVYSGKQKLKKEFPNSDSGITESNFDLFSIARMEGDLTATQERDHQQLVEGDEEKSVNWSQWQHTRLVAPNVEYRGKSRLKRKTGLKRGIIWLSVLSSAAAIALLFTLLRVDTNVDRAPTVVNPPSFEGLDAPSSGEDADPPMLAEKSLAIADDPVLFSIKKNTDGPVESVGKGERLSPEVTQDTLLPVESKKVEPRPLRLAANKPNSALAVHVADYDQIKPLNIPPTKVSITNLSLSQIAEIDIQETLDAYTEKKDISLWSIANAGIKGINKITGADMSLLAARDERGDLSGFRFKSKRFSVSSPIERSE